MSSVLRDVTVNWVYATTPDRFGKYSLQAVLDESHVEQLEKEGIKIKEKDGIKFYQFSKNVTKKDGTDAKPIGVYQNGAEFDGLVPNGAKADVTYVPFAWSMMGRQGVKGRIVSVRLGADVEPYIMSDEGQATGTDDSPFE